MQEFQDELVEKFREYPSDELLAKCKSGTLVELAQKIAEDELRSRGIAFVPDAAIQPGESLVELEPFETVARLISAPDADLLRTHLEAAGIPVHIPDVHIGTGNAFLLSGVGGIRVQVPRNMIGDAEEIMRGIQKGDYALEETDEDSNAGSALPPMLPDAEEVLLAFAQDPIWLKSWRRLIDKSGIWAGFNPFAVVFGITWFFFRKMYVIGILVLAADILVLYFFGFIEWVLFVRLSAGVLANILYYKKAERAVRKVQGATSSKNAAMQMLKDRGGINFGAAMLSVVVTLAVRLTIS